MNKTTYTHEELAEDLRHAEEDVRVDDNHVPATQDGTHPRHALARKHHPFDEAPGSGSERWPNAGWTEAGDGTNYPGLPNQAQADAVTAEAEAEDAERAKEAHEPVPEV